MINNKLAIAGVVILAILGFLFFLSQETTVFDAITRTISIEGILIFIFCKWVWKLKWLQNWLIYIPDLSGKWEGTFKSTYDDKSGHISVTIKQTLYTIYINAETEESSSISYNGSFEIDKNRDDKMLVYTYRNEPNSIDREHSAIHYGTTMFKIIDNNCLKGNYYTDRKTTGILMLKRMNK